MGIAVLGIGAALLLRRGLSRGRVLALVGLAAALFGGWWLVRPIQTSGNGLESLQAQIGAGQPVLLELQSPY